MANKFLTDIVNMVYADPDVPLTKEKIELVLRKGLEKMGDVLANGDKLYLIGFMNFEPKDYKAKKSKHPQTGEDMIIPAYRGVLSKPSDPLKAKLAEGHKRDHGV
jgi:nucleoid DNA-binding protein